MAGALLAAGGGWLYVATARETAPSSARAEPARPAATPHPFRHALTSPAPADPTVSGNAIQVPVVDFTEMLPGCHR